MNKKKCKVTLSHFESTDYVLVFDHLFLVMIKANCLSCGWLGILALEVLLAHSGFGTVGLG